MARLGKVARRRCGLRSASLSLRPMYLAANGSFQPDTEFGRSEREGTDRHPQGCSCPRCKEIEQLRAHADKGEPLFP